MKKRNRIALFTFLILGLLGQSSISAADDIDHRSPYTMNVNGSFIQMDVQPVIDKTSLLIPIRTLSSIGLTYNWDSSSQSVTIRNKEADEIILIVNSKVSNKNGISSDMPVPVQSKDGRVLVPIRFVTESLGYHVQYETFRKMIFIRSKDYQFDTNAIADNDLAAARRASIALPLTASFKPLNFSTLKYHRYVFPSGRADTYMFSDGFTSFIVDIKDGIARVVGQYVTGGRSDIVYKAGNVTGGNLADPVLKPYLFDRVSFYLEEATSITNYLDSEGSLHAFTTPVTIYSDIIQATPNNT